MKKHKLTLIGAGPGDIELISLKGLKALSKAKVLLYDALVNEEILAFAPKKALKIYVGKRSGKHRFTQDQINQLIVDYALMYGQVVRLKGGDSFVFGRGAEEIAYAQGFGIETEVIPGISSAISVPELQGIPLTMRGLNESFWIITGTTKAGKLSQDIELAAQSSATSVILMGMKKLQHIADIYAYHGQENTPVAIIENGSLPNEKIVVGQVKDIYQKAKQANMAAPAIIVIGQVVKLHPLYQEKAWNFKKIVELDFIKN